MVDAKKKKKTNVPASNAVVVTSLKIGAAIHERAKIYAVRAKTSLQAIVNEALAEYLKKNGA